MMTELMLVEGVSDVQLISYFLQNVYGWKHENNNQLGITPLDEHEHIESLSQGQNQLVLCGVGGNGKFAYFVEQHRVNDMIVEREITSLMVVTDRDEETDAKIQRTINNSLEKITIKVGQWINNSIVDSFGQPKTTDTYLLIIPANEKGALERVIINALKDITEESQIIQEVIEFVNYLKENFLEELKQTNKENKATVGTFFSVRYPKNAMRSFGRFISKIDWSKSDSLKELFEPFEYIGKEKPRTPSVTSRVL